MGLAVFLTGCDNSATYKLNKLSKINKELTEENESLKNEVNSLRLRVSKLKDKNYELTNTPEQRLVNISALVEKEDDLAAEQALGTFKEKFPQSVEFKKAEKLVVKLRAKKKLAAEQAERKKRLGFKVVKEQKFFKTTGVKVVVKKPHIDRRWVFDSYDDYYHYRDAERGYRHVLASLSITADKGVNNPRLPGMGVYKISGDKLYLISSMDYKFIRWKDYGSYLGNYADYSNDFAHTATVRFKVGTSIKEEALKKPLFIIAENRGCVDRSEDRLANPPVSYNGYCTDLKDQLSLDDVTSKKYSVLKIFNKNKL